MKKQFISVFLVLVMIISIIPMSSITVNAATFDDINKSNVFLKQAQGSVTCTLVASTMMVRRAAMMTGNTNWASITESSMKSTAWTDSGGLWYNFTYAGISVKHANLPGGTSNTSTLISLLNSHPEGIVLFKSSYPSHAILLTDYTNGVFYCADPAYETAKGRIPISSAARVTIENATEYWYVSSPKCTLNGSSTPSVNLVSGLAGQYYLKGKSTGAWLSVSESKDASTQPINTWGTWWENFRVKLVASGNGYKMNFPLVSSLLVNPYSDTPASGTKVNLYQDVNDITQWWGFEKVGDAYVIRCLYNPSLVLTDNGVNQATLTSYTGASKQLWYLYPATTTVTYNANGGSGAPGSQTKNFNQALTLSSKIPTRSGYTFLGWSTSSTATSATYSAGGSFTTDGNTTLYAVWMPQNIEICVDGNPDNQYWTLILEDYENINCYLTLNEYYGNPITYSYSVNNSNVSCSIGNANSSNQTPFSVSANSIGETIITLSVKDTATNVVLDNINIYVTVKSKEYTISYDANGGTGAPETSTHQSGTTHTVSSTIPERFGCTFLGWGKTHDATQYYWPGESFSVTSNITLYAKWSGAEWLSDWQPNEKMAVIFAPDCCTYYYMEPSATRTYHFESTGSVDSRITIYDKNGTELITDDDSGEELNFSLDYTFNAGQKYFIKIHAYNNATGDILFTAKPYWNLTYDANGGSGAPPSLNTTHGTTLYLSSTIPTRSGYTFLGWSTSSTATSATYSAGSSYTINSNITLYAVWQKNEVTNANKWVKDSKGWRYYDANGSIVKNQWKADSVGWCYVGTDGYCVTNCWKADSHGWCYLDANGRMVCNNWVYDGGKWYFMDANGYMVSNQWRKDSKGWCYLESNGAMATNKWVKDSKGWCYVGADGYCVTNKWVKDSKGWCYLDAQGRMVYNKWVKDSKGWCYVGSSGYMVTNQWVQDGGKWYYLDSNGYMVTGTRVINGKTYKFNSSGVWIG